MDFSFITPAEVEKNESASNLYAKDQKKNFSLENLPKDIAFKVVFIGNSGTGSKTSFVSRYVDDTFDPACKSTIGASFSTKRLSIGESNVTVQIWDTAGLERYVTLIPMYFRGAAGAVVGYDVTKRASFEKVRWWVEYAKKTIPNAVFMIIGNKADLEESREVSYAEGESLARSLNIPLFFETSAKTGMNVNEAMEAFINTIIESGSY